MTDTDWPMKGEQVAILSDSGRYTIATVENITKTQIQLDNGQRFHRSRLTQVGGSSYTAQRLKSLDDPEILQAHAARWLRVLTNRVEDLARERRNNEHRTAEDVLAVLDEIEAAVVAARAAITKRKVAS